MPQVDNISIHMYQGSRGSYKFTVYSDEAKTIPWNFGTASEVVFSVKKTLDSPTPLFQIAAVNGQNGNDWANGVAVFAVSSAQANLLSRDGKYDIFITTAAGPLAVGFGDVILDRKCND